MIDPAQYRPVGNTGICVSPIGLGTVKLGRNKGVKYPASFTIPDDQQAASLIDYAGDAFPQVLTPKVKGGWNYHDHSKKINLERVGKHLLISNLLQKMIL